VIIRFLKICFSLDLYIAQIDYSNVLTSDHIVSAEHPWKG